jgi:hypothetical protein
LLLTMLKEEGLTLVNNLDICKGVVTRLDPRNGTKSTIDLVVCNAFMVNRIQNMDIDECGLLKLKNYGKTVTETDHNTITVKLVVEPMVSKTKEPRKIFNFKNVEEREKMKELIDEDVLFSNLFTDLNTDINQDIELFMKEWNTVMEKSFHEVKPRKSMRRRVDNETKKLLDEEKWIRNNIHENPERGRRIAEVQRKISERIQ